MNVLLNPPTTVLVAGDDVDVERARRALQSGSATSIRHVGSVRAVRDHLSTSEDVGCVITGWSLSDGQAPDVPAAVAAEREGIPVLVWTDAEDSKRVQEAVNAGVEGFVRVEQGDETLRDRVDDLLQVARRRLQRTERSDVLQTILARSRVPMYIKDAEARHLMMSDIPSGLNPDRVIGKTDLDLYEDDQAFARAAYEDDMTVIREGREVYEKDEEYYNEGDVHWTRTNKIPWYDESGAVKGLVGISVPITDLKRKEQRLSQVQERFNQFASFLRHDLRTPLQVASGALELARESSDPEAFETAERALERLDEMIDDLGEIAQERRPIGLGLSVTPISRVVDEVWDVVGTEDAEVRLAFDEEAYLVGPSQTVRPMLENLLKNAIEHAGDDVVVEIGPTDWDGFYVADDGPGIPEDEREAVLEPGYTTAEDGDGTGLEIVSEIVDRNEWVIEITDSEFGGAKFVFSGCLIVPEPSTDATPTETLSLESATEVGDLTVGEVTYDERAERWVLEADGEDVWREENDFEFAYERVDGTVRLTARIEEVSRANPYSKATLMIRDSLDESAAYGAIGTTPDHGSEQLWRRSAGDMGRSYQFEEDPEEYEYYRIEREDDRVTLSISPSGESWLAVDQRHVELTDPVYVGIAAASCVPEQPVRATFEEVTLERLE